MGGGAGEDCSVGVGEAVRKGGLTWMGWIYLHCEAVYCMMDWVCRFV